MSKENSAVRTIALSLALILGVFIIAGIISAVISVLSLFEVDKGEYKKIYTLVDVENIDDIKNLNVDKLKAEYQELMKQKSELTSTYKDCEKEVRELDRKLENLNQYLGRTQPDPAQEQQEKSKNQTL